MIVVNMHFTILEHVKDNIYEGHIFFTKWCAQLELAQYTCNA